MKYLSLAFLTMQLACVGLVWVPVTSIGGTRLELSNMASLLMVASLALFAFPRFQFPAIFALLYFVLLTLLGSFAFHGGEGIGTINRSVLAVTAAFAVANLRPLSLHDLGLALRIAVPVFLGFFWLSASLAGINIIGATVDYLLTLNRSTFIFKALRPIFNAYVEGDQLTYLASVLNSLASAISLLFIISVACLRQGWVMWVITIFLFVMIFILFSTASVLSATFTLLLAWIGWMVRTPSKIVPVLVLLGCVVIVPFVMGDLEAYIALNVLADESSRSARVSQYLGSIDLIDVGLLTGHGYMTINGYEIHNFLLFSAVSAGIFAGAAVFLVMLIAIWTCLRCAYLSLTDDRWEYPVISGLMFLFLIRISVGGGGGLPSEAGAVALGLAMLVSRNLVVDRGAVPALVRSPQ